MLSIGLLFLSLFLVHPTTSEVPQKTQDALQWGAYSLGAVSNALGNGTGYNVKFFAKACKAFGPALQALGPISAFIFSFIDSGESETKKFMREEFDKLHGRLDDIENAIDTLSSTVTFVGTAIYYQQTRDDLRTKLERKYKAYLALPEASTKEKFRQACISTDPEDLLHWLYEKVATPTLEPHLFPSIIKGINYDKTKFASWAGIVGSDAVVASNLVVMCSGVDQHNPSEQLRKTRADTASRQLQSISDAIVKYEVDLQRGALRKVLGEDLNTWLAAGGSNDQLRDSIHNKLIAKYDWLYWSVSVYDGVRGFKHHTAGGVDSFPKITYHRLGATLRFRAHEKNIVAMWSAKDDYPSTIKKVADLKKTFEEKCITYDTIPAKVRWSDEHIKQWSRKCRSSSSFFANAKSVHDCLDSCMHFYWPYPHHPFVLHVVRHGNGLRTRTGPNAFAHNWCRAGHCSTVVIGI